MRIGSKLFSKAILLASALFFGIGAFSVFVQDAAAAEGDPPIAWTNGNGTGKWNDAENWNLLRVPVAGDDVLFNNTSQSNCLAEANSVPQNLASIKLASTFIGTVTFDPDFAEGTTQVLNVSGDIILQNGNLIVSGKQVDDSTGVGVTIKLVHLIISAKGVLHSDRRGFAATPMVDDNPSTRNGTGPGAAFKWHYGASHGGRGEDNPVNEYGSALAPITLGSSGSLGDVNESIDIINGGGAIKIEASGSVTVDGKIRCNAGDRRRHNAGAGGSIYLTCTDFSGSGLVQARGGNITNVVKHSPGGGGRISVQWTGSSTYDGAFDVAGGTDGTYFGQPGTLELPSGSDLIVKSPYKIGLAPGTHTLGTVTVKDGAELFCHSSFNPSAGPNWDQSGDQTGCVLNVAGLTVETNGVISATGDGFAPTVGPGGDAAGGSHGGRGAGDLSAYGNPLAPDTLGSGGRALVQWGDDIGENPRWGGGAIKINTTGTVAVDGKLQSNGRLQTAGETKGGAGGSIWITCNALSGSGSIEAKGGSGNGGGGRVALDYTTTTFSGSVNAAGTGTAEDGSVVPGSLNVNNHPVLASNVLLNTGSFAGAELLTFQLKPSGNKDDDAFESFSVTKLVFDLDLLNGFSNSDLTNIKVFTDGNADGSTSGDVALVSSSTTVSINGSSGTISVSFANNILNLDGSVGSRNFVLVADVGNAAGRDGFRVALNGANSKITGVGATFGKVASTSNQAGFALLTGSTSGVLHQIPDSNLDHYTISETSPQIQTIGWTETIRAEDDSNALLEVLISVDLSGTLGVKFYTDSTFTTETTTATLNNGVATLFLKDDTPEVVALTATDANGTLSNTATITIGGWPVDHYLVSATSPQTAGAGWTESITAKTAGDVTIALNATVALSSSGNAKFFADNTYAVEVSSVTLSAGTATIFVRDETAETMTLTAKDAFNKEGTADITVQAAAPDHYVVTATTPQIKGVGWAETVTSVDEFGNTVDIDIDVALSQSGSATFHGNNSYNTSATMVSLSSGVATIFVKDAVEETITLTVTDAALKTGTSPAIEVRWSLQDRINVASPGDTIVVDLGTYNESIVIDKALTLKSADPTSGTKPVIDGGGAAIVVSITSRDVILDGFEIRNAKGTVVNVSGSLALTDVIVRNCIVHTATNQGIYFGNLYNSTVENCTIFGVDGNGITLAAARNCFVKNCEVSNGCKNAVGGIYLTGCSPDFGLSEAVTVEGCYVHDLNGADNGIYLSGNVRGNFKIYNNVISDNTLLDTTNWHPQGGSAINLFKPFDPAASGSDDGAVIIEHNTIVNNTGTGPNGTTGHAIAWGWNINEDPTEVITVTNNLMHNNSGSALDTAVIFGSEDVVGTRSATFDYNLHTDATSLHDETATTVGANNITTAPAFVAGAYGKFRYRLADTSAGYNAGDDNEDMGALLNVDTAPQIISSLAVKGTIGNSFLYIISASGVPNPTYSISGTLPAGLSFSVDRITGTPTAGGTFNIQLTAANGIGTDDVETLVISIEDPPVITSSLTDTAVLNQFYSYTITAQGAPVPLLNASDLPTWLSLSGSKLSGTPTVPGQYTVTLSATNEKGKDTQTLSIRVEGPPVLGSSISALPNPAAVGDKVAFSVSATDPNGDALTYSWNFGDGSSGSGSNPTHVYAAEGSYAVTVTVTDGNGGSISDALTMTINTAGGSDDPGSPTPPVALTVKKALVKLNFKRSGKDMVRLDALLPIPEGFDPAGKTIVLDFGGVLKTWTLDAKGKAKDGSTICRLKIKRKKKVVIAQNGKLKIIMKKGDYTSFMTDEGMLDEDVKNKTVEVVMKITFNSITYGTGETTSGANPLSLSYRAKQGKVGMAKSAKK